EKDVGGSARGGAGSRADPGSPGRSAPSGASAPGGTGGPRTVLADAPHLAGRTGRGVTVAVIDSGVHVPHPHLPAVAGAVAFDVHGDPAADVVDRLGHGTAVAAAIHEKAPDAEIWTVK